MTHKLLFGALLFLLTLALVADPVMAQGGRGRGQGRGQTKGFGQGQGGGQQSFQQRGRGRQGRGVGTEDDSFEADRQMFHLLLSNRDKIRRDVTNREDGIETLTESDDPRVAAVIQQHVASMYQRVEEKRGIHMRDPLFRELFAHADRIEMSFEKTDKGIHVIETSDDPYVVKLLQLHAAVVSKFIAHGPAEVRRNHALPDRDGR